MMRSKKYIVKVVKFVSNLILRKYNLLVKGNEFISSKQYWENRYSSGGTSGSGSYGQLANFKASVLNSFIKKNQVQSVIEFGCGDGNQLKLAEYPKYIGFDVSDAAIDRCKVAFSEDRTKSFYNLNSISKHSLPTAELTLSLDVIYHLVEDKAFTSHMDMLFKSSSKYVIIYSSDFDGKQHNHERTRNFTRWIEENCEEWMLQKKIENQFPYNTKQQDNSSQSDFYIYNKN